MESLPIGVENYKYVQYYYYVDKTLFIKDIIESYLAKSVINQIKNNNYYLELQRRNCSQIVLYGLGFDSRGNSYIVSE